MPPRRMPVVAGIVGAVMLGACGGGANENASTTSTSSTTQPSIEGVQTYQVQAGHAEGPLSYPNVPPVGGIHNPVWQPCTFYDQPVPSERAVHSLEHGAIWITYRPDLPAADVEVLAGLARSRKDVLVSRWDDGLPSPLVATGWGRQVRLESATDPRLVQFVRQYANQGPEINAPC